MPKRYVVEWAEPALLDAETIVDCVVVAGSERAAARLVDNIEKMTTRLEQLPERGRIVPELRREGIGSDREGAGRWAEVDRASRPAGHPSSRATTSTQLGQRCFAQSCDVDWPRVAFALVSTKLDLDDEAEVGSAFGSEQQNEIGRVIGRHDLGELALGDVDGVRCRDRGLQLAGEIAREEGVLSACPARRGTS